jgi:hypothetical protein
VPACGAFRTFKKQAAHARQLVFAQRGAVRMHPWLKGLGKAFSSVSSCYAESVPTLICSSVMLSCARRQVSELSQQSLDSTSGSVLWPEASHQITNRLVPAYFKSPLLAGSCTASGVNLQLETCQSMSSRILAIFGQCLQQMFTPAASNHTQALVFCNFPDD